MLLSRLIRVQPYGAVIVWLPDRRAVTTATMTFPAKPAGRAILSEDAFETRAVVFPSRAIEPVPPKLPPPVDSAANAPAAGEAEPPARTLAPSKTIQATLAIGRGRLPNMAVRSACRSLP
jgi:hypothetical protein